MRTLKQQKTICLNYYAVLFFCVLFGCAFLFFSPTCEADTGKKIKVHPNVQKISFSSAEDLKAEAETYNDQAIALFEQGRYAEAQELWEKAINLMEHPQDQYSEPETVEEEQPSAETLEIPATDGESLETSAIAEKYQSGLLLLEQKEYAEAQRVFQEIDSMQPDYRNTKRYLLVISELLEEENPVLEQEPMSDETQGWAAADQEEHPITLVESQGTDTDAGFDPRQEEAQWEEAVEQAEQKLQDQIAESVEPIYQKALQHYKGKEYVEARDSFEQVQVLSPDYKLTAKYLDGIDEDILYAQQQKEEEQRLLEERVRRQDELEFRKAVAAKEVSYRKELMDRAEEIYQQAIEDFKNRKFEEAEDGFRKVVATAPDYKMTAKYLGYIQKARDEEIHLQEEEEMRRQALAQHAEEEDMKRTVAESDQAHQEGLRAKAEAVYQSARIDYGQGEIEKARAGFSEVERILPDYRSARKYLALIDEDVAKEQRTELEMIRQPGAPVKLAEKAEAVVVPTSRQRLEAQEFYRQAKESYKKREFVKAKALFEKVNAVVKGYEATEKFLARIDSDIQKEARDQRDMQEREARRQAKEVRDQQEMQERDAQRQAKEAQYQQGLKRREEQRQARKKALEEKRATAEAAAAKRRQEMRELRESVARIKNDRDEMIAQKVQELYREAESDYKNGLYALAKERFSEVHRISPGYGSTEEYLGNIAYKYGSEAAVETTPVPLRLEQQALPVPVIQEQAVSHPNAPVSPKVAEFDDAVVADYDAGVLLFKQRQYARAREKFEYVIQADPGHKPASKYLSRINSLVREEQQQQFEKEQRALARAMRSEKMAQKKLPVAVIPPPSNEVKNPEPTEAAAAPVEATASEVLDKELSSKAQELSSHVEQKRVLREKKQQEREAVHRAATEKAAQILAQKKQSKIKREEEKKHQQLLAQAGRTYAQALAAYGKKDLVGAKQKFIEVEKLSANFKETAQYLIRIDADVAAQAQKPVEMVAAPIYVQPQGIVAKEQTRKKAEELFQEAARLYASKEFVPAREKFQEVEKLVPGYKTTGRYLALIDRAISRQQEKESQAKKARDARNARLEMDVKKAREKAEKDLQVAENEKIKQQELELRTKQRADAEKAALAAKAQKEKEQIEKDRLAEQSRKMKQKIAQIEKEVGAANKRGQWDVAEQKISALESLLLQENVSAADKGQIAISAGNLREEIAQQREGSAKRMPLREQEVKPEQSMDSARVEAKVRNERDKAEKLRQLDERKKQKQAKAKQSLAGAPEGKAVWVDPPDVDAIDLGDDVAILRKQYAQVEREQVGVQSVIRGRLDRIYAHAVQLYKQGYYTGAKNLFRQVAEVQPLFKGTESYLVKIDQKLAKLSPSVIVPGKVVEAPSVYVKPRAQVVTDALDTLEAPRP